MSSLTISSSADNDSILIFNYDISNNYSSPFEKETNSEKFKNNLVLVAYIFLFILGLIGNFLVIYFVMHKKRMHTTTNTLITNLALADLLVIMICVPVTASRYYTHEYIFGELICKTSGFIQGYPKSLT